MAEYKKADAITHFNIMVDCPNCDRYLDVTEDLQEHLIDGLSAEDCDQEVTCEHCKKEFIVDNVEF